MSNYLHKMAINYPLRNYVVLIVAELDTGLGFHFCNHPVLSGMNNNFWFPLENEKNATHGC